MPLRELREIFANPWRIRPEIMRPIGMDEHAVRIIVVVSIPANVVALVHNQTTLAELSGQPLGYGQAGKTSANNEEIEHFFRQN